MRFKKNIAFLFGILALISYFSFYNLPKKELKVAKMQDEHFMQVYLKKEGLLLPMSISHSYKDVKSFTKLYMDYLTGKKKIHNASGFNYPALELLNAEVKEQCLNLQFNSTLLELKAEEELSFLQSLLQMAKQIEGVKSISIQVHQQKLTQLRHGTLIPSSLDHKLGLNSLIQETNYLHQGQSLIVYRLMIEGNQSYYVPIELRVSNTLSMQEKLSYIVASSSYHSKLRSPFVSTDVIECHEDGIDLKMKRLEKDEKQRTQIIQVIYYSLLANGFDKIQIKEFGKVVNIPLIVLNPAEI